jgi:hypothetical protein
MYIFSFANYLTYGIVINCGNKLKGFNTVTSSNICRAALGVTGPRLHLGVPHVCLLLKKETQNLQLATSTKLFI